MTNPHKALLDHADETAVHHAQPVLESIEGPWKCTVGIQHTDINPELSEPAITIRKTEAHAPLVIVLPLPSTREQPSPFFVRAQLFGDPWFGEPGHQKTQGCLDGAAYLGVQSKTIAELVDTYMRNAPSHESIQDILDAHL